MVCRRASGGTTVVAVTLAVACAVTVVQVVTVAVAVAVIILFTRSKKMSVRVIGLEGTSLCMPPGMEDGNGTHESFGVTVARKKLEQSAMREAATGILPVWLPVTARAQLLSWQAAKTSCAMAKAAITKRDFITGFRRNDSVPKRNM